MCLSARRLPRCCFFFFFLLVISPALRGPRAPPVLPTGVPPLIPRAASISMSLAWQRFRERMKPLPACLPRDPLRRMMSNVSGTYSFPSACSSDMHTSSCHESGASTGRTINPIHHVSHACAHLRLERNLPSPPSSFSPRFFSSFTMSVVPGRSFLTHLDRPASIYRPLLFMTFIFNPANHSGN